MFTCTNCGKQNPDDAKFCQNCGRPLAIICPRCQTRNTADANFCKNCGHSLTADSSSNAHDKPPADLPANTPHTTATSERRFVTILFCDVVGSTAMGEWLDPEEWTEIMNGMYRHMIPPVNRYGGTVARLMGDALLALFGAPLAHEDDPYRAIRAALDILEDLRPYQEQIRTRLTGEALALEPTDLEVRIGINTGLAVVGQVGSGSKYEYTAMGDAVNLASRMEQTAAPGTVQIAHDTFEAVRARVESRPLEPLLVKGKREPVQAYRVLGLRQGQESRQDYGRLQAPLTGRNQEMNELAGALSRLQAGYGQVICLIGEGGIGKSRLVRELARLSRGFRAGTNWYLTESYSFEASQPYGLFQRLLRRVGGIARDDAPPVFSQKIDKLTAVLPEERREQTADVLAALFGLAGAAGQGQPQGEDFKRELFESVSALVRAWAESKPTILVFEDLHWTDPASAELIKHLLPLTDPLPLLVICVLRPYTDAPAWTVRQHAQSTLPQRYQEIELKPLSAAASNDLVGALLNMDDLPQQVGALLAEKTTGVPYFIEEIVRDLIEREVLVCEAESRVWRVAQDAAQVDIPDSLEAVLVSRMDRLDPNTRKTLQLAAVIGRSFYYRVLHLIAANTEQLEQHIAQLEQVGMILESARQPELQYIFRHVLAQEAAYNTILFKRRRQYHRRVGEAIEQIFSGQTNDQASLLAHHFYLAGDEERAQHYDTIAAQNAARLYANEEALAHYSRALEIGRRLTPNDHSLARLYQERGQIFSLLGDFDQALEDLQQALDLAQAAQENMLVWRVLLDLGNLWTSRDYHNAGDYYERALDLARQLHDPQILSRSLNRMGNWNANAEHPQQAADFHREALAIIEQSADRPGLANTLDLLGIAHLLAGNYLEAHHYFDRAVELFRALGDRHRLASSLSTQRAGVTYHDLAFVFADEIVTAAAETAQEALHISKEIGWLAGESFALWVLSLNAVLQGRCGPALEMTHKGLQLAAEIDHRQWMAGHERNLAVLYCLLLQGEQGQQHAQRALELAQETGSQYWINQAMAALAKSYLLQGAFDRCRITLAAVLSPSTPMDSQAKRFCWFQQAQLALSEGDVGQALDIATLLDASISGAADHVLPNLQRLRAQCRRVHLARNPGRGAVRPPAALASL
ncbi:MAG: adenylate/guanylate cyclase domain-containing protein [Candidatus Promineifilaceae bacterium]|nr:adenylate/guanylate cyclase domain-containing protein [Candidatus Promineifilaceae bacterium]